MKPYYEHGGVTLYHGDCREITDWLDADVLVTDPPYGRSWRKHGGGVASNGSRQSMGTNEGIAGDRDTLVRDIALFKWFEWGITHPALVFGDLMLAPPRGTKQVLIYSLPPGSGLLGARFGWRRDAQAVYVMGKWPGSRSDRSSVLQSAARNGPHRLALGYGHPHAKPVDVMEQLIAACPPGAISDPFSGSGSTLVAARHQGRRAIGVEVDERYCEVIARRLDQGSLFAEVGE